jgi:hypothetical protein
LPLAGGGAGAASLAPRSRGAGPVKPCGKLPHPTNANANAAR